MLDIPPETWLSWANATRIWGLAIAAIAGVVSLIASIAQNNFQTIVSAKKDEALRVFQAESQERIAAANTQAAEANARAAEANEKAEQERLGRLKIEEKIAPRWLSTQQQQELGDRLSQFRGIAAQMWIFPAGTADTSPLANLLAEIFKSAGWFPERAISVAGQANPGIRVSPRAGTDGVEPARALVEYLRDSAGIDAVMVDPFNDDEPLLPAVTGSDPRPAVPFTIRMAIGTKP